VYYSHVADHHGDPYTNITNILVRRRADVTSTFGVTVGGGDQSQLLLPSGGCLGMRLKVEVHVLMWHSVQTQQESTNRKSLNYQRHCAFTVHLKLMASVAPVDVKRNATVVLKTAHLNGEGFYPIYRQ